MRRSPLKRFTPLNRSSKPMKRTPLNKVGKKQRAELNLRTKIRNELLSENKVCMMCGKPPDFRGLSLHHKTFLSHGGKTTKENTILLCGDCHAKQHGL